MTKLWTAAVAFVITMPVTGRSEDAIDDGRLIVVEAGPARRTATVVTWQCEAADAFALVDSRGNRISVQRLSQNVVAFRLAAPLEAGERAEFRVVMERSSPQPSQPTMNCKQTNGAVELDGPRGTILRYNTAVVGPPDGIDPIYRRSGHIHPVRTPTGRIVTEEFPADHPHQHGIFSAWVNTTFEGRNVDFWNQKAGTGTVEHVSIDRVVSGPLLAQFEATLHHVDISDSARPIPVVADRWVVTAYDQPSQEADYFLFDIDSRQVGIADSPLTINEYHYGGMAFRGAAEWFGQAEHDFLTSDGHTRANGNHTRPRWVCAHGLVEGMPCCITIMGHPENFRAPQPVRLHPDKPYFVFTPPVLGAFEIGRETVLECRYRYVVHDGRPQPELYERLWSDFADPPRASVKPQ